MTFTKRLRDLVRRGEITCSVRIWTRPHVKVGARYRMEEGHIEIDSIEPIGFRYYRGARARIRIPWRSRLAQDRQARPRPEYLFDPFSLCPCAPQTPLTALATSYSTDMPASPSTPATFPRLPLFPHFARNNNSRPARTSMVMKRNTCLAISLSVFVMCLPVLPCFTAAAQDTATPSAKEIASKTFTLKGDSLWTDTGITLE